MKKINIINTQTDNIDGYDNINITSLDNIVNGTCEEVVCNIMDYYEYNNRISSLVIMCKKLANQGYLTLKFLNGTKLCKDVCKGNATSQYLSSIIHNIKSLFVDSDIIELVSQIEGMKVHKLYNDNIFLVAVLKKEI